MIGLSNNRRAIATKILLILACLLVSTDALFGRNKHGDELNEVNQEDDIPGVPFLVETLAKEIYAVVNCKKYKFFLYMTVGKLPDEPTFIVFLNYICNVLYGLAILSGFLVLPRGPMLMATILTIFTGPALVLVLLGCMVAMMAAFAMYPVLSVLTLWMFFFLTSQLAQVIGRRLGLDHDGDGDVDFLDLLSYAASTKWGKLLGIPIMHSMLNEATGDPFQEIRRRLDEIQESTSQITLAANTAETTTTISPKKNGREKQS